MINNLRVERKRHPGPHAAPTVIQSLRLPPSSLFPRAEFLPELSLPSPPVLPSFGPSVRPPSSADAAERTSRRGQVIG